MNNLPLRTTLYLIGFLSFWASVAIFLQRFDSEIGIELPTVMRPLGLPLMMIGALIGLPCVFIFVTQGNGTPVPFDPPKKFVVMGCYRYVRNPMFIGSFLAILGFGMVLLSASVVGLAFAAFLLAHFFVVFIEEPGLERRFGDSYLLYKQSVNRWVPRFRRDVSRNGRG